MQKYHLSVNTVATPQTKTLFGSSQKRMASGGYGWEVTPWQKLDRFLVLGTSDGTYYVGERELTEERAESLLECLRLDGLRTVQRIVEISDQGRAPSNDPALFALAMACKLGDDTIRQAAYQALSKVARIGTHLFHFMEYVKAFGGLGGSGLKRALQRWYNDKPVERVTYQALKYQQRDGWSHRDVLRLAHPKARTADHQALYHYIIKGRTQSLPEADATVPMGLKLIWATERCKRAATEREVAKLIREYNLPRECVPSKWLNSLPVWEALLDKMPITALLRNLGKLSNVGLIKTLSEGSCRVASALTSKERLKKGRVHPMAVLLASKVYAEGRGLRGKMRWEPDARICDALDAAFYSCFDNVEPTGKRILVALDVSGSMVTSIAGMPFLSCREAATAMALITCSTEPHHGTVAFTGKGNNYACGYDSRNNAIQVLPLSPRQRLDDAVRMTSSLPFGATDCALPILWALENKVEVDAFVMYTDNESWAGPVHVHQALKSYRNKLGIHAKLVVCALSAQSFSVACPDDPDQLDIVGLDSATPQVLSDFIRG